MSNNPVHLARQLAEACEADPTNRELHLQWSQAAFAAEDVHTSLMAWERALDMKDGPLTFEDHFTSGRLYLVCQYHDRAEQHLKAAARMQPQFGPVWFSLSRIEMFRGNLDLSKDLARRAMQLNPQDYQAALHLLDLGDDHPAVLNLLEQAAQQDATAGLSLARYYQKQSDHGRAAKLTLAANALKKKMISAKGWAYDDAAERKKFETFKTHFSELKDPAPAPDFTPIFIVGMPRSGTSILESVISAPEQVTAGGEKVLGVRFRNTVGWIADEQGGDAAREWIRNNAAEWQGYWGMDLTTPFITDKMPVNYWVVGPLLHLFPNARFVHIRRDPRDVALSIFMRDFQGAYTYAFDLEAMVQALRLKDDVMAHWSEVYQDRIFNVSYEDFARAPEKWSRMIFAFCGLPWTTDWLSPEKRQQTTHTFSATQVRSKISDRAIGQWKDYQEMLAPVIAAFSE